MKNALKLKNIDAVYFDELPVELQDYVAEQLKEAFDKAPENFNYDKGVENIECKSRSGFIPFSHNKGGLEINGFTDLMSLWGSGTNVSHKKAQAEIDRQIDYHFKCVAESTYANFKEILDAEGLTENDCNYHTMQEIAETNKDFEPVLRYIEDAEAGDSEDTIMFSVRFMYHGNENGIHTASVSAAVNTEGPYHRSHISWSPKTFCEGAEEVEIEFKTFAQLKKELAKALKKVTDKVF